MKTLRAQIPIDAVFRALADRTRLRILNLLRGGELCVGDLVDVLQVPQPTASRHLAYLRGARLVLQRKEGLWVFYRLAPARTPFLAKLLECLEESSTSVQEISKDEVRLERIKRTGGCCPR